MRLISVNVGLPRQVAWKGRTVTTGIFKEPVTGRVWLRKHNLEYEDIDIINNRANYAEMVQKSGQPLSPCVEIDGVMLADISGEEVENYLLSNDLVKRTDVADDVPTNAGCSDEEHAKMATKTIRFF